MSLRSFSAVIVLSLLSFSALSADQKTFCIWDPVGRSGPVMSFYSDLIPKAQSWGLNIKFEAYTDEKVAANQFKAGRCEAALLTSILSRQFVKFAGTMDAIGAINSQEGLELAIATLARERAGNLMTDGNYEVVSTFPVGSMYAFVRDRSIDTIDDFAGKKLAILNGDPQMQKFADLAGASKVNVSLSTFSGMFNNGALDIVIMPALAYNTFELYNGLGKKGGIIDYRLYYGMLQTIAKRDEFPEDFGFKMRSYMLTRMKAMDKMVIDAEKEIPRRYWIKTNQFVKDDIDHFSKRVRFALKDDGVNDLAALKLFWKIRCRLDPSRGECKDSPYKKIKRDKKPSSKSTNKKKSNNVISKNDLADLDKKVGLNKKLKQQIKQEKKDLEEEKRLFVIEKIDFAREKEAFEQERLEFMERIEQAEVKPVGLEAALPDEIPVVVPLTPTVSGDTSTVPEESGSEESKRSWWDTVF